MARTPLFALIRTCFQTARRSLDAGRPADELMGEENERRLSRRRFLELSGAAAGAAAIAGCGAAEPVRAADDPKAGKGGKKVIIIGAGLGGLVAGWRLKQAGVPVEIFEASERTGGRMLSIRGRFADNQVAELGGELVDTGHKTMHALAKELGLPMDDLHDGEKELTSTFFFGGERRSTAQVIEAFKPIAKKIEADIAPLLTPKGEFKEISYKEPNGAEKLDRMTIAAWLDAAGAAGWIRKLLEVAFVTEYGLELGSSSALNLLVTISPKTDEGFKVFGESDERFHFRGGNDKVVSTLAAKLSAEIRTGHRLEAVSKRADGSLVCTVNSGGGSKEFAADHVLLAIPFTLLRGVKLDAKLELPDVKKKAIAELGYGTNAKLMIGFSERVWQTRHKGNGESFTDLGYQCSWDTSRKQEGKAGILTNYTGGENGRLLNALGAAEQAAKTVAGLDKVFPGIAATRAGMKEALFHWPSNPFVKGSYSSFLPGQWTGIGGAAGEKVGNLHFAGEHCSTAAQGFMEGAAETGESAAKEILEALGVKPAAVRFRPLRSAAAV